MKPHVHSPRLTLTALPAPAVLLARATLLDECVAALGGAEALAAIESYRIEAECTRQGEAMLGVPARTYKGTGEILWHRSGHARLRGACEVVDGQPPEVWLRKVEFGVKPECSWSRVPDREREIFGRLPGGLDGTAPYDPLRVLYLGIARHGDTMLEARTVRREPVQGRDCHRISARYRLEPAAPPRAMTLWLDVDTKRPVRCTIGAFRSTYSDWRDVGGIQAPFRLTAGVFCGDSTGAFRELAEVKTLTFNSVAPEEVAAPAQLRDMAEVAAEEMAREQRER